MKVFISGASGLVGGNCFQYFRSRGYEVTGTHFSYPAPDTFYYNTLEPGHPDNYDLAGFGPDVIVHCGALTHVDYCESHPEESFLKTVQSTIHLATSAKELGAKLVFISTDYVFDGTGGPYTEQAPVHPINIYGQHKLDAEEYIRKHLSDYLILRITNVYGREDRNKNFIARILQQVREGHEVSLKLPVDQYASPTHAWDIARALYLLLEHGKTGLYHIGGTDYMNRVSLAMKVLTHFPDSRYHITALSTKELQQPASRPLRGGFISERFNREFPEFVFENVSEYVKNN